MGDVPVSWADLDRKTWVQLRECVYLAEMALTSLAAEGNTTAAGALDAITLILNPADSLAPAVVMRNYAAGIGRAALEILGEAPGAMNVADVEQEGRRRGYSWTYEQWRSVLQRLTTAGRVVRPRRTVYTLPGAPEVPGA